MKKSELMLNVQNTITNYINEGWTLKSNRNKRDYIFHAEFKRDKVKRIVTVKLHMPCIDQGVEYLVIDKIKNETCTQLREKYKVLSLYEREDYWLVTKAEWNLL